MKWPIAVGANLYRGYRLKTVCKSLSKLGVDYIDIDFIETPRAFKGNNMLAHLSKEDFNKSQKIKKMLDKYNLQALTFSGHMTLLNEEEVKLFIKKMKFAKEIGAKYISTGTVPKNKERVFIRNLDKLTKYAEKIGIYLCLETEPGEVISCGKNGKLFLENYNNSPYVKMTYDFGNTYYGHKGNINLIKDFKKSLNKLGTIHFKDVCINNNHLSYCTIGKGIVNFVKIGKILKSREEIYPITIEIPYFFQSHKWSKIEIIENYKSLNEIENIINESKKYITQVLS